MSSVHYSLMLPLLFIAQFSFANRIDSLLLQLGKSTLPSQQIHYLLNLSDAVAYDSPKKQKEYAKRAYQIFNQSDLKNDSLYLEVLLTMANGFEANKEDKRAIETLNQINQQIPKHLSISKLAMWSHNLRAMIHNKNGSFESAIKDYQQGLEIAENLNNSRAVSMFQNNIALIYAQLKEYSKATQLLEKSQKLCEEIGDTHGKAISISNLGDIAQKEGKLDLAIERYNASLQIVDSLNLKYGVLTNHLHLGETYQQKGLQELAFQHNLIAYDIAKKQEFKGKIAEAALSIAQLNYRQKFYDASLDMAKEALHYSKNLDSKEEVYEIHECLSKNYEAVGNFEKALFHHQKFEAVRDSFFNEQRVLNFAVLEHQFAVKKKEAENKFLKEEQLKNKTIIKQQNIIGWSVGVGLLLFALATWVLLLKNKQTKIYNKKLEEEVKQRTRHLNNINRKLSNANKELEQFAFIASHDLKEPLRNISGFANLINRKVNRKEYDNLDEYLQFINQNTKQMSHLIEDVLAYSKIEENNKDQKFNSLAKLVQKAKTDLQRLLEEKQGRIIYQNPALYDGATKIKLPAQLSLIFKNLIENGIKYNQSNSPTIRVNFSKSADFQIITFSDNGIGIEQEYQERVFEMFKRLHHRGEYQGSGIGLAICKKIAENLGGSLKITKSSAEGTVFELKIPVEKTSEKNREEFAEFAEA